MELWVRSQAKDELTKVDNLCVMGNRVIFIPNLHNGRATLGIYETEERALEVLDEIQNLLQTFNPENMAKMIVYEMPEE